MSIYLIRHGETDLNAARVLQMPGTPLSTLGREQAQRLAEHLRPAGILHVLASDYARAEQTARPLERATGATLECEPLLRERNFGDLRGMAYADLSEDPFAPGFAPPGGETEAVFQERVAEAWKRIVEVAARVPGHLAVVTHGLVLQSLARRHLGLGEDPAEDGLPQQIGNTSLTVVESAGAGPAWEDGSSWRVALLACTAHLGPDSDGQEGIAGI